jgi:molybdopterin converting factor subunit 1
MSTVTVLYFAAVGEFLGKKEETMPLPEGTTIRGLLDALAARHPGLSARLPHLRVARNEEFASLDAMLAPGDVVALIPPVAGG